VRYGRAVSARAFPVVYAQDVGLTVRFYETLGFEEHVRLPPGSEPGYVGMRRDDAELAVVTVESPRQLIGLDVGAGPRFEMFVYVHDLDREMAELRGAGVTVLRESEQMPWGERVAYVADPDGNPVALADAGMV
jgi:lactoylglutathione lyase